LGSPIPGILVSSLAGAHTDRVGRRRALELSLIVFATAPFLYLFVTQPWQLLFVRFYHGFATAVFMPVAMASVADRYGPEQRGEKLALFSSATMVGRSSAPILGGTLLFVANFSSVYLACAISGVTALVMSIFIPWGETADKPVQAKYSGSVLSALGAVVRDGRIMVTSSMEGLQYYAMGAFEAFLPVYAKSLGMNEVTIGTIMGVQVVSMLLTKPLLGRLSDRHGREPSIVAGLVAGSIVVFLMPHVEEIWLLGSLSVVFGMTVASVTASTSALVSEIGGKTAHGSSIGVLSSVMDIGHSVGPLATGLIVGAYSYQMGFGVASVMLLLGAAIFSAVFLTGSARHKA
jgi:DHA1 family multidrug resistance protein-like MFS transporter